MSTYAIGDIHGCLEELRTLLESLRTKEDLCTEDTLVFVGDYIDRGNDSKGVIDYLLQLRESQKCVFLMGNHEDMMLWYLGIRHGRDRVKLQAMSYGTYWIPNGGNKTLQSYGIEDVEIENIVDFYQAQSDEARARMKDIIGERHLAFLEGLQYFYIEGSNLFVHAGVSRGGAEAETPTEAIEHSTDEHLLWDRSAYLAPNNFGTMIYGHTPSKLGVRWNRRQDGPPYSVGVDVGTVFGANPLIAVRVDDWKEFK